MGWKSIKGHYKIEHMVQVADGDLCIGSSYVPDIIRVTPGGEIKTKLEPFRNALLTRYKTEIENDIETFRALMGKPDEFSASISVYTYKGGEIIEKQCEELGWPNPCFDGEMQYENTHSADKAQVVKWAKRNAAAASESLRNSMEDAEKRLADIKGWLAEREADLAKLESDFPDVPVKDDDE